MTRTAALMAMLMATFGSGACAPMMRGPMYGPGMFGPPARPAIVQASPAGRWDEVMSLRPNWIIDILDAEGTMHTGRFVKASVKSLRFVTSSGEIELVRRDVIRVDLIHAEDGPGTTAKEVGIGAASGAASMAGAMALIPFLATGKLFAPPPRFWATGAVIGGLHAAQRAQSNRRPRTIYVARIDDM